MEKEISANELKIKGVSAINNATKNSQEAAITVRGKRKYVVMTMKEYAYLREKELEAAIAESKKDLLTGKFVIESVESHINRLLK